MPEEVITQAAEGESLAPQQEVVAETQQAPDAAAPVEAPKPPEVDLESLLKDPAIKKKLFDHPEIKQDYEHRISSEAGRRAKALQEQAQARWQQEQERQRMLEMDDTELGNLIKQQALQKQQVIGLQAEAYRGIASEIFGKVHSWEDLSDEDKTKLVPTNFKSLGDYIEAIVAAKAEKITAKQMPTLVKQESEALLREELNKIRGTAGPVSLAPAGTPSFRSADEVNQFYIEGKFGTRDNPYGGPAKRAYEQALRSMGEEPPR
jgi:hypothetical protein